jgi:hypothetical protein
LGVRRGLGLGQSWLVFVHHLANKGSNVPGFDDQEQLKIRVVDVLDNGRAKMKLAAVRYPAKWRR